MDRLHKAVVSKLVSGHTSHNNGPSILPIFGAQQNLTWSGIEEENTNTGHLLFTDSQVPSKLMHLQCLTQ